MKRRGYRIELGEIERGLYQHPSIMEAAVIGVSDDAAGVRIVAYLAARAERAALDHRDEVVLRRALARLHEP